MLLFEYFILRILRKEGGLGRIKVPLVSDVTKEISKAYDILVTDGPDKGLALRGTYIIDPSGVLQHASVNNLRVGRSVEEALRLIDGFQFAEKHPDLGCPANWKPGKKQIKTDHEGAKEYFQSLEE